LGACRLCFALTTRLLGMLRQQCMLCMRQVYKDSNGRSLLRLGDIEIDYNPAFRLYLTSRNPNPHFLPEVRRGPDAAAAADGLRAPPEVCLRSVAMRRGHHATRRRQVCIRVSVINFTVTAEGLEEQLLGDCVRRERPDLEELRDSLLQSIAADKRQLQAPPCLPHCRVASSSMLHAATQELRRDRALRARALDSGDDVTPAWGWREPARLQELEERMLRLLREAGGSLLDDEVLLGTLNNSRSTSAAINVRVAEAQATEASINAARESYRPAAARASTLYFVVSGLSAIDSMCALAHAAWCSACTAFACHGH